MIFYFYFLEELQKIEGISICGFFFFFKLGIWESVNWIFFLTSKWKIWTEVCFLSKIAFLQKKKWISKQVEIKKKKKKKSVISM